MSKNDQARPGAPIHDNMHNDLLSVAEIARCVDAKSVGFVALSDRIWEAPELAFEEHRAVEEQISILQREGFRITRNVGGMATAFVAEAGQGGPVVGILGEYDALPGLSQEAGQVAPRPVVPGAHGHGCGHNLLGAGSALAAVALKDALLAEGIAGRVRYFGCPAEESGSGKTFMARAGLFDDLDAAFCWHPGVVNAIMTTSSLATVQACFRFRGRASHAAATPHLGRSALDAVELMNIGVNYMREHMPSDARIHYSITNTGGDAPNVVQAYAESLYLVRSPRIEDAWRLFERVRNAAVGATLMTETSVEVKITDATSSVLPNRVLQSAMYENMVRIGPPSFDEADRGFAERLQRSAMTADDVDASVRPFDLALRSCVLHEGVLPSPEFEGLMMGTTDVGDVSWVVPTAQCWTACFAIGTPFHTWQLVSQGKLPAAHKGMVLAAKTIAATAADVIRNPELLARAKTELRERTGGKPYLCPIPPDVMPEDLRGKAS